MSTLAGGSRLRDHMRRFNGENIPLGDRREHALFSRGLWVPMNPVVARGADTNPETFVAKQSPDSAATVMHLTRRFRRAPRADARVEKNNSLF